MSLELTIDELREWMNVNLEFSQEHFAHFLGYKPEALTGYVRIMKMTSGEVDTTDFMEFLAPFMYHVALAISLNHMDAQKAFSTILFMTSAYPEGDFNTASYRIVAAKAARHAGDGINDAVAALKLNAFMDKEMPDKPRTDHKSSPFSVIKGGKEDE